MRLTKVFSASLDSMEMIIPWILSHLHPHMIEKLGQHKIELALEEIIINIYMHGYKQQQLPIMISLTQSYNQVILELRDFAPEFNLLNHKKSALSNLCLDSMEVGGQGVGFIKAVFPQLEYCYENQMNVLKLEFN